MRQEDMTERMRDGYLARRVGARRAANPQRYGTHEFEGWDSGWMLANSEIQLEEHNKAHATERAVAFISGLLSGLSRSHDNGKQPSEMTITELEELGLTIARRKL